MNGIKYAVALAAMLALAGCGDGGGAVNSTPTPTVATPYNPGSLSPSAAFTNTMQSGNFVAISPDFTNDFSKIFVSYDAASNNYFLNFTRKDGSNGRITFDPAADPNVALHGTVTANGVPDPTEVAWSWSASAGTSGNLGGGGALVTHTGSSGFVYSYTALMDGGTQLTTGGYTSGSQPPNYSVFGIATPDAAVPRTGSASYALEARFSNFSAPATGTGTVDFAAGTYKFSLDLAYDSGIYSGNLRDIASGALTSTGALAASANGFAGSVDVTRKDTFIDSSPSSQTTTITNDAYHGQLKGAFFGPQAQELGATFSANLTSHSQTGGSPQPSPASPLNGVILGHK